MIRKFCLVWGVVLFLFGLQQVSAQRGSITITGKVVDRANGTPIEFATVLVGDPTTEKPIVGTTTIEDGSFTLKTKATDFYIAISFIGYTTK